MKADDVELAKQLLDLLRSLRLVQERSVLRQGNLRVTFCVQDQADLAVIDSYPRGPNRFTGLHGALIQPMLAAAIENVIQRLNAIGVEA